MPMGKRFMQYSRELKLAAVMAKQAGIPPMAIAKEIHPNDIRRQKLVATSIGIWTKQYNAAIEKDGEDGLVMLWRGQRGGGPRPFKPNKAQQEMLNEVAKHKDYWTGDNP